MIVMEVVCVLRSGGDFGADYVEVLKQSVSKHLSVPHDFVCYTDMSLDIPGVVERQLWSDWPGWWSKLEIFREANSKKRIYFDLDTVINGSLDDIATYPHRFSMLRDVGRFTRPASGVMAWTGERRHLFFKFDPDVHAPQYMDSERGSQGGPWGDGGWIGERVPDHEVLQDLFPGQIVSYKWNTIEERKAARVICYHGPPRPRDTGWAR